MTEVERKYLNVNFQELTRRLIALNAIHEGGCFESNLVFDDKDLSLCRKNCILRLREKEWATHKRHILTFKAPPADECSDFKIRQEYETEIADPAAIMLILAGLGYRPIAKYEKMRDEWHLMLKGEKNESVSCFIDLDIVEFANIVEIEAPAHYMAKVEELLHLTCFERSTATYHDLNREWRKSNNLPPSHDLIFSPEKRSALRKKLGLPN